MLKLRMSSYDYTKPMVYLNEDGNMTMQIPDYMNYAPQQFEDNDTSILNDPRYNYADPLDRNHIMRIYKLYMLPEEVRDEIIDRLLVTIRHNINKVSSDSKNEPHNTTSS